MLQCSSIIKNVKIETNVMMEFQEVKAWLWLYVIHTLNYYWFVLIFNVNYLHISEMVEGNLAWWQAHPSKHSSKVKFKDLEKQNAKHEEDKFVQDESHEDKLAKQCGLLKYEDFVETLSQESRLKISMSGLSIFTLDSGQSEVSTDKNIPE